MNDNKINEIPKSINKLTNLKELYLNNNLLENIYSLERRINAFIQKIKKEDL